MPGVLPVSYSFSKPIFYDPLMLAASFPAPVLIGSVFIGIGILVSFLAFRTHRKAVNAQQWPRTPGHVVRSWVGTRRKQKGRPHYYIGVEYAYRVADKDYTGKRVSFGGTPMFNSKSTAETTAGTRYPAGMNLNVYYDPQDPSKAILDKRIPSLFAGFLVAITFAAIGTFIMISKF